MIMETGPGISTPSSSASRSASFTCLYLGMVDDPSTITLFPSEENLCLRCKHPAAPNFSHQALFCLSDHYADCPLRQGNPPDRVPARIRWKKDSSAVRGIILKAAAGVAVSLGLALFFILWMPGIISDLLVTFAPTPASGGTWPTLTPSMTPYPSATQQAQLQVETAQPVVSSTRVWKTQTSPPTIPLTLTPTITATRIILITRSFTPTHTANIEPTAITSTPSATRTPLPSETPSATPSSSPTVTPTPGTPTNTPAPIKTNVPTDIPIPTQTRSSTP